MSEGEKFEYSERVASSEVADYLEKLAEGIRNRSIRLQGKGHTLTLLPEEVLKLEVAAESKSGKGELEIQVSWKDKYVVSAEKLEVSSGTQEQSA